MKVTRMSAIEKRNRHMAAIKAWRVNKSGRINSEMRFRKISMMRRKSIIGVAQRIPAWN